jgi:hypothetical protein
VRATENGYFGFRPLDGSGSEPLADLLRPSSLRSKEVVQ